MTSAGNENREKEEAPKLRLSPFDVLLALGAGKRSIAATTLGLAALGAALSYTLPRTYTGAAKILPPQQAQSTASLLLGQLGGSGLGSLASGIAGVRTPGELFVGMLRSRTVADALVERFHLESAFHVKNGAAARSRLVSRTRIEAGKNGIITVEVDGPSPELATDLANGYFEELHRLTSQLAVTEAAQRRLFFEQQLQQTRDRLAEAEGRLRDAIEAGGLVSADVQGRSAVENVARLRGQIAAKEIQVESMKAYAAPSNPEFQRVQRELLSMRDALRRMESGPPGEERRSLVTKGVSNVRLLREVKYQEVLFEQLAKAYEVARVDEAKDAPVIQVLDRAIVVKRPTGPNRFRIVFIGALVGFMLSAGLSIFRAWLALARQSPIFVDRAASLRAAWSPRRRR